MYRIPGKVSKALHIYAIMHLAALKPGERHLRESIWMFIKS